MRRHPGLVLLLASCLSATACGTQVSDSRREQASRAALELSGAGSGSNATTTTTTTAAGAGSSVAPGATTAPTSPTGGAATSPGAAAPGSLATGPTGAVGSGNRGSTGTGGSTWALPPGGNGGATDVGVTATSITIGNVSDLSGPQPGLFQPAVNGTNAYFAYINSQGGVYGRQLKISVADSQTSCDGDRGGHEQLVSKVFAFAGSFSLFDQCGATILKANPQIPDSHLAVTPDANALPNNFSINPIGDQIANGSYRWAATKFGSAVKKVGMMYANLPAVNNVAALAKKSAQSAGWNFVYSRAVGATETDFTSDIIQMRNAGVQVFYTLFNADEMANFKAQADQQGFKPVMLVPLVYDQSFFTKLGGSAAAEGIYGFQTNALFFSAADAKLIPAVADFQKYYAQVTGGTAADGFAADGWAQAELLVDAIKKAGPMVTRAKVMTALKQTSTFDANGFTAPSGPASKRGPICYLVWQIKGGNYVRIDSPANGFRCDGKLA